MFTTDGLTALTSGENEPGADEVGILLQVKGMDTQQVTVKTTDKAKEEMSIFARNRFLFECVFMVMNSSVNKLKSKPAGTIDGNDEPDSQNRCNDIPQ